MPVLSIQSNVVSGHVGNAAAVPALQALGIDVWPIDTVDFSNHPGHGAFAGRVRDAAEIVELVSGLQGRKLLGKCDAVLSGYLGTVKTGQVVRDAVAAVRLKRTDAVYCCDPVIGDAGRVYVARDLVPFFRDTLVATADIATPNAFEAGLLTGNGPVACPEAAALAAQALLDLGPSVALVTGVPDGAEVVTVAADATGVWAVRTQRLDVAHHGAGDCLAALFLGHYLRSRSTAEALSLAVAGLIDILRVTAAEGAADLRLVPCLPRLRRPPHPLTPDRLR